MLGYFDFDKMMPLVQVGCSGVIQELAAKQAVLLCPSDTISCTLCGFWSSDEVNSLLCVQLKNWSVFIKVFTCDSHRIPSEKNLEAILVNLPDGAIQLSYLTAGCLHGN